jgi:hypothetical protein
MKSRPLKPEQFLRTREERVKIIRKLLSQELAALMEEARTPLPTNFDLACAVIERLDPDGKANSLLKLAALQQLVFEINETERPRRW